MPRAYIGMGGNLGDSQSIFRSVLFDLTQHPATELVAVSSFYITKPLDNMQQPDYLNAVACLKTLLSPYQLLNLLQSFENSYGRVRSGKNWESRTLDLDILLYNDCIIQDPGLVVPHPGMLERDFVLLPLYEISPQLEIPGFGPIYKAVQGCENRGMRKINEHNTKF